MQPPKIDIKVAQEVAAKHGFKIAGPDHPVYREGPTITFISKPIKPADPAPKKSGNGGR